MDTDPVCLARAARAAECNQHAQPAVLCHCLVVATLAVPDIPLWVSVPLNIIMSLMVMHDLAAMTYCTATALQPAAGCRFDTNDAVDGVANLAFLWSGFVTCCVAAMIIVHWRTRARVKVVVAAEAVEV